ncbi:MAG: hypothetical protein AAGJ94_01345 [Pseudomonadota bacterium]
MNSSAINDFWQWLRPLLKSAWGGTISFFYITWVCRVAAVFSVIPAAFIFVPQARDMLIDVRQEGGDELWLVFFLALTFWLVVIYVAGRHAVAVRHWAVAWAGTKTVTLQEYNKLRSRYLWSSRLAPFIYTMISGLIVFAAFRAAKDNIPKNGAVDPSSAQYFDQLTEHLERGEVISLSSLAVVLIGIIVIYCCHKQLSFWPFRSETGANAHLNAFTFRFPPFLPELQVIGPGGEKIAKSELHDNFDTAVANQLTKDISRGVMLASFVLLVVLVLAPGMATVIQRSALALLLLTTWIPVFLFLTYLGNRLCAPVTGIVVVALALFTTYVTGDNHQVRSMRVAVDPDHRPSIDVWIDEWKASVGCAVGGPGAATNGDQQDGCDRRPIVIAAAGGASRAGFYTASTLGHLMDETCRWPQNVAFREGDAAAQGAAAQDCLARNNRFTNHVFAISAVSGSALGAAAWIAALSRSDDPASQGSRQVRETAQLPVVSDALPAQDGAAGQSSLPCGPLHITAGHFGQSVFDFIRGIGAELFPLFDGIAPERDRFYLNYWHDAGRLVPDGVNDITVQPMMWQDCLELSVAGDYISEPIAMLLTRDMVPTPLWTDRNTSLEDAFDAHITGVLTKRGEPSAFSPEFLSFYKRQINYICTGDPEIAPSKADQCPRRTDPPRADEVEPRGALGEGDAPAWMPLFVSNGASVHNGNRIVISPIAIEAPEQAAFLDTTDAYSLLRNTTGKPATCGFPMKTVVSHSARFPIVSTEGDFPVLSDASDDGNGRDAACEPIEPKELPPACKPDWIFPFSLFQSLANIECNQDQVVDGGYFESVGITSAYDIAVRLAQRGLRPLVLVITNDPAVQLEKDRAHTPRGEQTTGALGSPIQAVSASRAARGATTAKMLCRLAQLFTSMTPNQSGPQTKTLDALSGEECFKRHAQYFAFIDIDQEAGDGLSMSWWLSPAVQKALNANVTGPHNVDDLNTVYDALNAGYRN